VRKHSAAGLFSLGRAGGIFAAGGLLVLTAGAASAGTVLTPDQAYFLTSFSYNGYSVVNNTDVTIAGPVGLNGTYGSGQIDLTGTNANQILPAWCIDIFHDLQGADNYAIVSPPFTTDGGNGGAGSSVITSTQLTEIGELVHWGDININASSSNSPAAQLAIWTIEYQGTGDTFTSSSGAVNSLVTMLVSEAEHDTLGSSALLEEVVDPGINQQGLVFEVALPTNTNLATPLPSTWTMLIAGFAGLGFFAYRGMKKDAAALVAA
jgi:hypothetical protein